MSKKTLSGRNVISPKLVGESPSLNGSYSDAYVHSLNIQYSVDDILGDKKEAIATRSSQDIYHFVMGSPTRNCESEVELGFMLINSAIADSWVPKTFEVEDPARYVRGLRSNPEPRGFFQHTACLDRDIGLYNAMNAGLVVITSFEESVVAIPSQEFLEFCLSRRCA